MRKIIAILTINPDFVEFAIPELKAILSKLNIPLQILLSESMPLPNKPYLINYRNVKNFPYVTLTVPDFEQHRTFFENASKKAVMISKFVLLAAEGKNYEELFANKNQEVLNEECRNWNEHVICDFVTRNRVLERKQQVDKIHLIFDKLDVRGKIDLKTPQKRFQLIEQHTWYPNHHEKASSETLERVYFGIELSSSKQNKAKFNIKYQLGDRVYLGPTSTDNDLAFMMCNQAKIEDGSYVFDPFVGTAGLLIPPATNGALVFGCDLDMRVLNGYSIGRINTKSSYYHADKNLQTFTPKIYLNFDQYNLPRPSILRMDCTRCAFAPHTQFDAIITDPPYGIRAMSRSMQKKQLKVHTTEAETTNEQEEEPQDSVAKTQEDIQADLLKKQKRAFRKQNRQKRKDQMTEEEKKFKDDVNQRLNRERIDQWDKYNKDVIQNTERSVMFQGLLRVASKHLKVGGRLVFLYPIYEDQEYLGYESLPKCEGFEIIDFSRNMLSKGNSRVLITMVKL